MKQLLLALFLLVGIETCAQDLTVASYNVRYRSDADAVAGNGWERRAPWICGLVEFERFDIFGAQEVLHDQLIDMLTLLPDYSYIGVGRDDGDREGEYAPIFFNTERFRLLDSGTFWLSKYTDRPNRGWDAVLPRICTWGRFVDRDSRKRLWCFNLHMDHVGVMARKESARLVLSRINEICEDDRVILMGDFNVDQNDEVYDFLASSTQLDDSYLVAQKRYVPNGTFNAFSPFGMSDSRIDHIFLSPNFEVLNYGILTDTYRTKDNADSYSTPETSKTQARTPSDHFPVVVKLKY